MKNFHAGTQEGTLTFFQLSTQFFFFFFVVNTALSLESQCCFCSDYLYELQLLGSDCSSTSPFANLGRGVK